jgi:adenylate cyclase
MVFRSIRTGRQLAALVFGFCLAFGGAEVGGFGALAQPVATAVERPAIAVLPFANLSNDPEQVFFADGMAEDILASLTRFAALKVIARNSTFTYKGKTVEPQQIGRELGVHYVLSGAVAREST